MIIMFAASYDTGYSNRKSRDLFNESAKGHSIFIRKQVMRLEKTL